MSLRAVGFGVVLCAVSLPLAPVASGASLLTPFNVIVSGNFTDSSDVGGGLAVGGFAKLGTLSVADGLNGEPLTAFPGDTTFAAAGGASGGEVAAGNYYISGTDSTFYNNGTGTRDVTDPVSTSMTPFSSESIAWSADATTAGDGCSTNSTTHVTTCSATKTGLNVINLSASQAAGIGSANALSITGVSSTSWLIINVAGASDTLSGNMLIDGHPNAGNSSPAGAQDVLFNFYNANSLTLGGSSMGSVLAPGANVTGGGGQFVGSLVAESFIAGTSCGGTEFHDFTFQGGSTPEPAPVLFVGVGMMALALFARRRGRNRIAEGMDSNSLND